MKLKKIRIFLAACKSNYELVNSDSVSNDNVIKTVPAKTEPQINDLAQTAATSTAASDKTISKMIFVKQDCVVSFGEKSTECNDTWVMLERVILKLDDRNILLNELCLNDKHMSYMQLLLKRQFLSVFRTKVNSNY